MSEILEKNCLAQRDPGEADEQPHQWWETSKTKLGLCIIPFIRV
jgi:hypothetical protein